MTKNSETRNLPANDVEASTRPDSAQDFGKTCSRCHGQNHYARMCPSRETEQKVHVVNETDDSDSQSDPEFVYMVTEGGSEIEETGQPVNADETVQPVNAVQTDKWVAPLLVNGTVVLFRLDTGAKANLISLKDIKALKEIAKNTETHCPTENI